MTNHETAPARSDEYLLSLFRDLHRTGHLYQVRAVKRAERHEAEVGGDWAYVTACDRQLALMQRVLEEQ